MVFAQSPNYHQLFSDIPSHLTTLYRMGQTQLLFHLGILKK